MNDISPAKDGLASLALPASKKDQTEPSPQQINALISLLNNGRPTDVIRQAATLLKRFPKAAVPYNIQGTAYASLGRLDAAQTSFTNAIRIQPKFGEAHSNLGNVLQDKNDFLGAIKSFRRALRLDPGFAEAHSNLGNALKETGKLDDAIECYTRAIDIKPGYADAHRNLGIALAAQGDLTGAIESIAQALKISPNNSKSHIEIGVLQREAGDVDAAIASYNRALELESESEFGSETARAIGAIGGALSIKGYPEAAIEKFKQALEIDPELVEVYQDISRVIKFSKDDPYVPKMRELMNSENISQKDHLQLSFALGKAECDIGNREQGVSHFIKGNSIKKAIDDYQIATDEKLFESLKDFFNDATSPPQQYNNIERTPIFIVGMPRSGTSLTEQILSSHTDIFGAGELGILPNAIEKTEWQTNSDRNNVFGSVRTAYLEEFSKLSNTHVITDKMPHNFRWLGFILTAIPEAKVVHLKRQPEAVCWSNFKTNFIAGEMSFTNDLQDIAKYYRMYEDLMSFWHNRFPEKIYDLDYQRLTENQESETRRLFEYLEIEWQGDVLEFHKNRRSVKTASSAQVKKKMYQGSSQEWEAYEQWLGPMLEILRR